MMEKVSPLFVTLFLFTCLSRSAYPSDYEEADVLKVKADHFLQELYLPELGAQVEYFPDSTHQDTQYLAKYGRVWAYTQGIALAREANVGRDQKVHQLADWLYKNAVRENIDGTEVVAGWNFSENSLSADNWVDVRLVTGANAWALQGIAIYIASDRFTECLDHRQEKFKEFYHSALNGLFNHQREDGRRILLSCDFRKSLKVP